MASFEFRTSDSSLKYDTDPNLSYNLIENINNAVALEEIL